MQLWPPPWSDEAHTGPLCRMRTHWLTASRGLPLSASCPIVHGGFVRIGQPQQADEDFWVAVAEEGGGCFMCSLIQQPVCSQMIQYVSLHICGFQH